MIPEGVEVPPADEVTQPWWDATREHELLLQTCRACGEPQHYPRALCSHCGGTDLGWVPALGFGVVDSFTHVHRPLPGYEPPHVVARIRLAEGPVMLSVLVGEGAGQVRCDDAVTLEWHDLPDGRALPVFALVAGLGR